MALVVLLRGINVGSHRTFQPSVLAKQLKHLDAVNIGAAGTFLIRRPIAFNATIFNTRNATVQFTDPMDQTITNSQYLSSGVNGDGPDNMEPARRQPHNAGFGAATGALGMRTIQM